MQYLKRNTKFSILPFLVLILFITISISSLAKTEIYFSLYGNSQIFSITVPKPEIQTININTTSQDELIKMLKISEPLAHKIIALRDLLIGGFKEPQDLTQLPEITNLDWKEWEKKGTKISIE